MYSIIVLILTLGQVFLAAASFLTQSSSVFYNVVVYGSPFYLTQTLLRADSALLDANALYIGMLIYHIVKYGFFFLAQTTEGRNAPLVIAVILEAAYLLLSAYYLN